MSRKKPDPSLPGRVQVIVILAIAITATAGAGHNPVTSTRPPAVCATTGLLAGAS